MLIMDTITCPVSEELIATVAFDQNESEGGKSVVSVKLNHNRDRSNVIAQKSFLWPSKKMPSKAEYDEISSTFRVMNDDNIAEIPMRLNKVSSTQIGSVCATSQNRVYPSFKSKLPATVSPLYEPIMGILRNKNVEEEWQKLIELCKTCKDAVNLCVTLSPHDQQSLVNFVAEQSLSNQSIDDFITALVRAKALTAPDAIIILLKYLLEKQQVKLIEKFVQESPMVSESVYAFCLHVVADDYDVKALHENNELFLALLEKQFTDELLLLSISKTLTEKEIARLIDLCVNLMNCEERNDRFVKMAKLVSVFIDSHAQRLVWDTKCHNSIKSATEFVADLSHMAALFSELSLRRKYCGELNSQRVEEASDYFIRKIVFEQKQL